MMSFKDLEPQTLKGSAHARRFRHMQGGARILVRPVHLQRNGWTKSEAASNGSPQSGCAHGWLVLKDTEARLLNMLLALVTDWPA